MRGSVRIGSVAGIPILVNPSWLIVLGLFTFLLATQVYPEQLPDEQRWVHIALGIAGAVLFFVCIVLHEFAHSAVARLYNIPVHSITLFLFGGVARISRDARTPLSEFLIAVVGPLSSALIGGVLIAILLLAGEHFPDPLFATLAFLGIANMGLAIFNLLPAFPMDGGRVFRSIVWWIGGNYYRATVIAAWTGRVLYWAVMALGIVAVAGIDVYIADDALNGLWLVFIGFTLDGFARQSLAQAKVLRALDAYTVSDIMQTDLPVLESDQNLGLVARGAFQINPRLAYFVEDHGALAGILTVFQVFSIPEAMWDRTTVGEAMLPSRLLTAVAPGRRVSDILMEMEAHELTHMPVVENGTVIGLVGREGIIRIMRRPDGTPLAA